MLCTRKMIRLSNRRCRCVTVTTYIRWCALNKELCVSRGSCLALLLLLCVCLVFQVAARRADASGRLLPRGVRRSFPGERLSPSGGLIAHRAVGCCGTRRVRCRGMRIYLFMEGVKGGSKSSVAFPLHSPSRATRTSCFARSGFVFFGCDTRLFL